MKHKNILTILILLFANVLVKAQSPHFSWVKQISGEIKINSLASDASGNIYSVGLFGGSPDFDPNASINALTDSGLGDIFISKIDPLGNLLWVKQIGGASYDEAKSITIDANGNLYVTGFFSLDSIDFDPSPSIYFMSAIGENSFVLKLDNNGNFVWAKQIESIYENYAKSISLDNQNNVLVTGRFDGTADFDPSNGVYNLSVLTKPNAIYIWKLDNNGNFIWAKYIETLFTRSQSIASDGEGNVYIEGQLYETNDFDPSAAVSNLSNTLTQVGVLFSLKLNSMGDFLFAKKIENVNTIQSDRSILVDSLGNSYYTGSFLSTADFDPNAGIQNLTPTIGNDNFLLQLNSNGDFAWVNQLSEVKGMALDKYYNVFTCGNSIKKFNTLGLNQWTSNSGFSSEITISPNENIYSTGNFINTYDFDPDSSTYNFTSTTANNTFILKLSANIVAGINDIIKLENDIDIYPNPNNGEFKILANDNKEYKLYNAFGVEVKSFKLTKNEIYKVDLLLPNGIYYLQTINSGKKSNKIIITN